MTYANFVDRFRDKSYIGSGGFAKVYKVYDYANNKYVALKIADFRPEFKKFTLQNEVELINQLPAHPNVIKYDGCYRFNTGIAGEMDFAILPYYENGNLEQFLLKNTLDIAAKRELILGILKGIHFLHLNNIIHRDLKAQNILIHEIDGKWIPKIADFGLSRTVHKFDSAVSNSSIGVSFEYAAPEQIRNQKIYKNVDLWSVGVLIFRIIANVSPFRDSSESKTSGAQSQLETSQKIIDLELPEIYNSLPEPYKLIISKCLVLDPKQRVTRADELISLLDPSFKIVEKNNIEEEIDEKTVVLVNPKPVEPTNLAPDPNQWKDIPMEEDAKTSVLIDKTEVIRKEEIAPPKPQPKTDFQYSPPTKFEAPKYDNPNTNVTQIFAKPVATSSSNQKREEPEFVLITNSFERVNKLWLYIPLFLIGLFSAVYLLYTFLNPAPIKIAEPVFVEVEKVESAYPEGFLFCFENYKNSLGGIFKISPKAAFESVFSTIDKKCFSKICAQLKDIERGKTSLSNFYINADGGGVCTSPLLSAALEYHHEKVMSLPSMSVFYNSGSDNLTIPQKNELNKFLKKVIRNSSRYGLLIVGRASAIGNRKANKNLSKRRAESIIDFIESHYVKNIKTDFIYFGAEPPQLTKKLADKYSIAESKYANIGFGKGKDKNFLLRLNQSVMLVIYDKKINPFGL